MSYDRELLIKAGVPDNDDALLLEQSGKEVLHELSEGGTSNSRYLFWALAESYKLGATINKRPEFGGLGKRIEQGPQ